MSVTAQSVVDRAEFIFQDTSNIRWTAAELILWLNDAQREIALLKPDATATNTTITLATGTKQSIPAGGNRLLKVIRNMSAASGGTGKTAIRLVSRDALDTQEPNWHDPTVAGYSKHTNIVKNYMYSEEDPRNFYVYPGVAGSAYIELVYSANPATIAINANLGVPDVFANAVLDYVLYRGYMKETETASQQRATMHFQLFMTSVAGKTQIDSVTSPNFTVSAPTAVPPPVMGGQL
jgi:hypothetical protein|tara:strand:+ start:3013 stop:3720 length:708 start_codon:yes stop_codon:yes gene_type:complete